MGSGGPAPSCCLAHQRQRLLPHLRVLEFDNTMCHRLFLDVRTTLGDAAPARCGAHRHVGLGAQIPRPINSVGQAAYLRVVVEKEQLYRLIEVQEIWTSNIIRSVVVGKEQLYRLNFHVSLILQVHEKS